MQKDHILQHPKGLFSMSQRDMFLDVFGDGVQGKEAGKTSCDRFRSVSDDDLWALEVSESSSG